jgi:hypothetical protein
MYRSTKKKGRNQCRKGQTLTQTPCHLSGMVFSDHRRMTLAWDGAQVITYTFLPYPCSDSSPSCVGGMLTTPTLLRLSLVPF